MRRDDPQLSRFRFALQMFKCGENLRDVDKCRSTLHQEGHSRRLKNLLAGCPRLETTLYVKVNARSAVIRQADGQGTPYRAPTGRLPS